MNKLTDRQKEVIQYELDQEKEVLRQLEKHYQAALNDIDRRIRILESDELTQSKIYRIEYQKALKKQVEATLEKLHADEYATIQGFLSDSYTTGFVGTAYDMFGQGVPLIMPIDQNAAVKAIITDSKIDVSLYEALGVDTTKLKKAITAEITRGIAAGLPHSDIARNLANAAKVSLGRAKTIIRTESHRIQEASAQDARKMAVSRGASVVKQWKAIKDGKVRHSHRVLDGQIVEVDEPFQMDGMEAMYPGDFGDPSMDCNCRCRATQRAKIALGKEEYQNLQKRASFFGLMEEDSKEYGHEKERIVFSDFKKKYIKASETEKISLEKSTKSAIINSSEMFRKDDDRRKGFTFISQDRFDSLTVEARKNGAVILKGTPEVEQHLKDMGASASHVGGALLFMSDVCVSEVLEETCHFMQELRGLNNDKEPNLRMLLNEIDARHFILNNAKKYKVPRSEIEMLQEQLDGLNKQLEEYYGGG